MSLATRCTHCGTIFKVVQDQLKVSEGWVRCGRCNEVFNALPSLFDLEKEPPPPRQVPAKQQQAIAEEPIDEPVHAGATQTAAAPSDELSATDALRSHGLLSEEELNLGIESQPPGGWARTQPATFASSTLPEPEPEPPAPQPQPPRRPQVEEDLAMEPPAIEGTTDFELDTAIAVDDNTPLEMVLAATSRGRVPPPAPAPEPAPIAVTQPFVPQPAAHEEAQPWLDEPPEDVPSTDEADALDSRYLMPSERERHAPHRRQSGPEFADAQFPSDAMIDAEEDWASDFGPSAFEHETRSSIPSPAPLPKTAPPVSTAALRTPAGAPVKPLASPANLPANAPAGAPANESPDDQPTLPSRFADDIESDDAALPPPSKRPGKSGTRGRAPADQTPEFLKRAQREAFWRHPAMRAVLSVCALGLLLTLGLQLMHQFRDLIAAYHPASRPLLAQWCGAVGCKLSPPLRLESLQVDNLELVRTSSEGPDSYRLTVVVRNQATIDLAWPDVDLTLTDESGAVIARRVFSPKDAQWLDTADPKADTKADAAHAASPAASVPTAAPSQRSTTLQWRIKASDIRPAGYTAELFYP
ncbi:MAG: DUF3426 domain-containing protein [Burkholderiales bacterium]|nr:MAG: DUF3426 domain-containing protein [Burkholderiales bacterium]